MQPVTILQLALLASISWYCESLCVHGEVIEHHIVPDDSISDEWRVRREAPQNESYAPLRVYIHHSHEAFLSPVVQEQLRRAVDKAAQTVSSALSVIPIPGPLVLRRPQACGVVFGSGLNKGKCSRLASGYKGEMCLDIFKLPYVHLEGFDVYNATHTLPVFRINSGTGVTDADFILYITSIDAPVCSSHNASVTAFSSHCQVDQTGQPVAGLVNFCPFALARASPSQQSLDLTALHELLHVLGFSTKLFETFKQCKDRDCLKLDGGQWRLVSPAVVNKTRHHFNCFTQPHYGPALQSEGKQATSHWDSHMMYSSVMTPTGNPSQSAVLDPITLAVFEDSGWYKVNYSSADAFLWGRGEGCSFGTPDYCQQNSQYFCTKNVTGCHFSFKSKGVCDIGQTGKQCGIFTPQGSCTEARNGSDSEIDTYENFSPASRCFLSTIALQTQTAQSGFTGRCYKRQCSQNGTMYVKLPSTDWLICHAGHTIQVPGLSGEIQCPQNSEVMCMEEKSDSHQHRDTTQHTVTSTAKTPVTNTMVPNPTHSPQNIASALALVHNFQLVFIFLLIH